MEGRRTKKKEEKRNCVVDGTEWIDREFLFLSCVRTMEAESRKMFMEQFTCQLMKQMELYTRHSNIGRAREGKSKWTTRMREKEKGGGKEEECSDKELYDDRYGESEIECDYERTKKSDSYINEGEIAEFGNEELSVETLVTCCDFETNVITFLPKLISLAYMCPFEDVAVQCRHILERWQQHLNMPIFKIHMPLLSPFVYCSFNCQTKNHDHSRNHNHSHDSHSNQQYTNKNANPFVLPGWKDNKILRLFQETFVRLGQPFAFFCDISVTNLDLLLSRHPTYWVDFTKFYETLMLGNGQMSHEWRYYVAIMAASRYDCAPLVGFLECQFQEFDGNYSWIDAGLSAAHPKLKKIALLNALLAHNPWTISPKHIAVSFFFKKKKKQEGDFPSKER
ncbi:sestrin-2 [Reticulomyxa filosa]|uniref:Sestrin-2 n=1 Tax=Reticulomyxa filosa TaxID=46433 RepID=X6NR86_RETFI|nr:sestrin-2 [Reticulomyxa filosa]|eukprot:ETO28820.1 sestrin-2 [Reticulomyxa filosa]